MVPISPSLGPFTSGRMNSRMWYSSHVFMKKAVVTAASTCDSRHELAVEVKRGESALSLAATADTDVSMRSTTLQAQPRTECPDCEGDAQPAARSRARGHHEGQRAHHGRVDCVAAVVEQQAQRGGGAHLARLLAVHVVHGAVDEKGDASEDDGPRGRRLRVRGAVRPQEHVGGDLEEQADSRDAVRTAARAAGWRERRGRANGCEALSGTTNPLSPTQPRQTHAMISGVK